RTGAEVFSKLGKSVSDCQDSQAGPDRKGVEATDIDVNALPRLHWGRIEVEHQHHAHHQEEHQIYVEILGVFFGLEEYPDQTQDQRQHQVVVKIGRAHV